MTEAPMSAASVLPRPSPVCPGDTDALSAMIGAAKERAVRCRDHAATADRSLSNSRGSAVRALSGKLAHLQASTAVVEESAAAALLGVQIYAREVTEIHVRAATVKDDVGVALGRLRASISSIEVIAQRHDIGVDADWRTPPPLFMPATDEPAEASAPRSLAGDADTFNWSAAAGVWRAAVSDIEQSCVAWRGLVHQRELAEQALVGALARTVLSRSAPGAAAAPFARVAALTSLLSTQRPWEPWSLQQLIGGRLTPVEAAETWQQLESEGVDIDALIDRYSVELAGVDGIPFHVRDRAGRVALEFALSSETHLEQVFARMGLASNDMTLAEFRKDLVAVRDALTWAQVGADGAGRVVQLAMLGSHDGVLTAAMSVGDLDTASRVGVFVSGMNAKARSLGDATRGFQEIQGNDPRVAVVTWLGYRAPGIAEEPFQNRAERGSWPLATFLDGIATRHGGAGHGHTGPERFVLLGHSYGTNVAAEALKLGGHQVHAFVAIGSAGLKAGTVSRHLNVTEIHATHASRDNIAPVGKKVHIRELSNGGPGYIARVDPRDLAGARVFSSEESADGKAVTMHNLVVPMDWGQLQWAADSLDGVASVDEVGYLDPASTTVKRLLEIVRGPK